MESQRKICKGNKFNHWTVIDDNFYYINKKSGKIIGYLCECDCHNKTHKIVSKYHLLSGHSTSCGCTRGRKHGQAHTKLYKTYYAMIKRCENKNYKQYKDYGGRGIKICEEWKNDFQSFYDWAVTNGYKDGLTLDRIDVNGDYKPDNCRWVTHLEQNLNKRNNILLTYNNKTQTLKEWSREDDVHITYGAMLRRYHSGWTTEDILFKEIKK